MGIELSMIVIGAPVDRGVSEIVGGASVAMNVGLAEAPAALSLGLTESEGTEDDVTSETEENDAEPEISVDVGAGAEVTVTTTVLTTTEVETVTEVDSTTLVNCERGMDADSVERGRRGGGIDDEGAPDPVCGRVEMVKVESGGTGTLEETVGLSVYEDDGSADEEGGEDEDPPAGTSSPPKYGVGTSVEFGLGAGRSFGYESSKISSCAPSLKL